MADDADLQQTAESRADYVVGYGRPPLHSRFKPGQSGNPAGRAKGSQNFKTLLDQILKEEIPLIDGEQHRRVSKAEAITRRLVIGALKGDARSQVTLFRLAEMTGQFEPPPEPLQRIERIILTPLMPLETEPGVLPANSETSREEP